MDPIAAPLSSSSLGSEAWERRYQENTARWDLGQPAPPLVHWLAGPNAPPPGRTIVLGAGRGHDALLFARYGFEVMAVDFAPAAIAALTASAAQVDLPLRCLQRNIFDLVPDFRGQFDYVVEHTCFCALDPALRPAYVNLVADLLVPGQGELLAVFFTHQRPGGPPFGISPSQILDLFQPQFDQLILQPTPHSIASRQGEEHLGWFRCLDEEFSCSVNRPEH